MEIDAVDREQRDEFLTVLYAMRDAGATYEEIDHQHHQMINPWRTGKRVLSDLSGQGTARWRWRA